MPNGATMPRKKATTRGVASRNGPSSSTVNVGDVLRRLRTLRGLSLEEVAQGSGLSQSFLSAVERGASDIALGRLARVAAFFQHDIGSLLGYAVPTSRPTFVDDVDRKLLRRGSGVEEEVMNLPGLDLQMVVLGFAPRSAMTEAIVHEGVDVIYVTSGELTLCLGEEEITMRKGECAVYSATHRHRFRNDSARRATAIGVTTGRMA